MRGKRYELVLLRSDGSTHHLYPEPFLRNDRLVRLLSSIPGAVPDRGGAVVDGSGQRDLQRPRASGEEEAEEGKGKKK